MKTNFLYLTIALTIIVSGLSAQETKAPRIHQAGIQFSSLNSFGVHYKTGNEKTLFRVSLVSLNTLISKTWGKPQDSIEIKTNYYGAGFSVGFEKQVRLVSDFAFRWGFDAGCNYMYQKNINSESAGMESSNWSVNPGIYLILGVSYTLKDHFVFGAEIAPGISYTFAKQKIFINDNTIEFTGNSFNFGLNSNSASLSVAYRFGK